MRSLWPEMNLVAECITISAKAWASKPASHACCWRMFHLAEEVFEHTCSELQRMRQYWGHNAVIYQHKSPMSMSYLGYFLDIIRRKKSMRQVIISLSIGYGKNRELYVHNLHMPLPITHTNITNLLTGIGWTLQPNKLCLWFNCRGNLIYISCIHSPVQ